MNIEKEPVRCPELLETMLECCGVETYEEAIEAGFVSWLGLYVSDGVYIDGEGVMHSE